MNPLERQVKRAQLDHSASSNKSNAKRFIGNQELLWLKDAQMGHFQDMLNGVTSITPKSVLFALVPPIAASIKRSDVVAHFQELSRNQEELVDSGLILHMKMFEGYRYLTTTMVREQKMGSMIGDVAYVRLTDRGTRFARPAAFVAINFEHQFDMTTVDVLGNITSSYEKADSLLSNASLLMHLTAESQGLNTDQLVNLTLNKNSTVTGELTELVEKGFVRKFTSVYKKVAGQEATRRAHSKAGQIQLAINAIAEEELITPFAIWKNLPLEAKDEISMESIIKELSSLKSRGKLEAAASASGSIYQITELGKTVTESLLVPLVKIAKEETDIMVPNKKGHEESLKKTIIPRIISHPDIITNVLQGYQKVTHIPEEIEKRKIAGTRQALEVYTRMSGELLASTIRLQANILPNDWRGVLQYMLQEGYLAIGTATGKGREKSYVILEKGQRFLQEMQNKK